MTGGELKRIRYVLGLSTERMAERVGVSKRTIEGYEMGRRKIPKPVEMLINQFSCPIRRVEHEETDI